LEDLEIHENRTSPWLPAAVGGVLLMGVSAVGLVAVGGYLLQDIGDPPAVKVNTDWAQIDPPQPSVTLGCINGDTDASCLQASSGFDSPSEPFEIHAREVTWAELDPWIAKNPQSMTRDPRASSNARIRATFPATSVPWHVADAYCASIGAALPTEAQWELAARGTNQRPNPWGADFVDRSGTHAFGGATAQVVQAGISIQDRTPNDEIFDLAGNAREWTADLYASPLTGTPVDWSGADPSDPNEFRTLRGLPLREPFPSAPPQATARVFGGPVPGRGHRVARRRRLPMCAVSPVSAAL
jgi:hypothetical protein